MDGYRFSDFTPAVRVVGSLIVLALLFGVPLLITRHDGAGAMLASVAISGLFWAVVLTIGYRELRREHPPTF